MAEETSEFSNVFIFVSDALNYNFIPEKLVEASESDVVRTLAPSHHSAKSFMSLASGLEASNHSINSFGEKIEQDHVFEMFQNSNLFDDDRSAIRYMLGLDENHDLDQMDEPFFWMERSLETHIPYGVPGHGEDLTEEQKSDYDNAADYFASHTHEELLEKYRDAAEKSVNHFLDHVEHLKDRGLYEDTLIIFTADHGDALGDRIYGRKRYGHNSPGCRQIAEVPTVFFNKKIEASRMRSVDIIETVLQLTGNNWMLDTDGVNITEELPDEGECPTGPGIVDLNWRWDEEKGRWEMTKRSKLNAIIEDIYPERLMMKLGLGRRFNFGEKDE